mgnify:FL=1|tara:strand:+ start:497 stop:679 length:183 start_codon:yes stop_codon:yes gene_type:complete
MVVFDFILGDVEELLKETNKKLGNIEKLLEFLLSPPDLAAYKKGMSLDDIPRKSFSDLDE